MMRHLMMAALAITALGGAAQTADDTYAGKGDARTEATTKQTKDEHKAHEKAMRRQIDSIGYSRAAAALERGYWVLVADRVNVGHTGYTVAGLDGNKNFVFQQAGVGMVQFAFNSGAPGTNGMGGMTLEGKVGNVTLTTDKKGNIRYSYNLVGNDINAQVDITVFSGGDHAQVEVTPAFSGPRMTLRGRLVPYIRPRG